jgi:two-component system, cell cycle sensor histidine kinase and response regulator CckA
MPVLLVEDDPVVRTIVEYVLTGSGLDVIAVGTGEEAVSLLETGQVFELLLTDVQLPGHYDGWSMAVAARDYLAGVPVVYLTATHQQSQPVDGSVYLRKPVSPKLLLEVVGALLGRQLSAKEQALPPQQRIGDATYIH